MATLKDTDIDTRTYPVRLRGRGQITVPQAVRDDLDVSAGDILTLFQVGDVILLTPKQLQVPRLADKIADMMQAQGISLADLLEGLEEVREAMWRESQENA